MQQLIWETQGIVFGTELVPPPAYVIKVLDPTGEELPIYERLLRQSKWPNNHTVPAELIRNDHPILIMPALRDGGDCHVGGQSPRTLVDIIIQLVEVRGQPGSIFIFRSR